MDDADAARLLDFARVTDRIFETLQDWQIYCDFHTTQEQVDRIVNGPQALDDADYRYGLGCALLHARQVPALIVRAADLGFSKDETQRLWQVVIDLQDDEKPAR